jgi:hypothetical protein
VRKRREEEAAKKAAAKAMLDAEQAAHDAKTKDSKSKGPTFTKWTSIQIKKMNPDKIKVL